MIEPVLTEGIRGKVLDSLSVQEIRDLWQVLPSERTMPESDLSRYTLLRNIDPYGDTVFNGWQSTRLIDELQMFTANCTISSEEAAAVEHLMAMLSRCQSGVDLYLMFYGD